MTQIISVCRSAAWKIYIEVFWKSFSNSMFQYFLFIFYICVFSDVKFHSKTNFDCIFHCFTFASIYFKNHFHKIYSMLHSCILKYNMSHSVILIYSYNSHLFIAVIPWWDEEEIFFLKNEYNFYRLENFEILSVYLISVPIVMTFFHVKEKRKKAKARKDLIKWLSPQMFDVLMEHITV